MKLNFPTLWAPRRAALLLGVALLSACAEPEVILIGAREDILPGETVADGALVNGARAIILPAQRSNADWAQGHGTAALRNAHPALAASPALAWATDIGSGDSRKLRITADPVVAGGLIYTLDANGGISAVRPDGSLAWSADLRPASDREGDATGGGMSYDGGTLYVSVGFGLLAALNAADGTEIWRQQLDATASGRPTIAGDLVYLVAGDDTAWAVRRQSGRIAWQLTSTPSAANVLGAPAPALADDLVIFAFGSGELIAAFRRGGLVRWSASVGGKRLGRAASKISDITGAPVVDGGRVYAGNHSGRLAALDAASGNRIWTAQEGAQGPVWPAGDSIFVVTDLSRLARIDAATGDIIWSVELPGFVRDKPRRRGEIVAHQGPVIAGGRVLVASGDGLLRSFDPRDGNLLGTTEIPGGASTAPVVAGGTAYIVSARGQLLAFR